MKRVIGVSRKRAAKARISSVIGSPDWRSARAELMMAMSAAPQMPESAPVTIAQVMPRRELLSRNAMSFIDGPPSATLHKYSASRQAGQPGLARRSPGSCE